MEIGQYDITDGSWRYRYLVHKIMKATAEVSIGYSHEYDDFDYTRELRFPLARLQGDIESARFTKFKESL